MSTTAIRLDEVTKTFRHDSVTAVDALSLEIETGTVSALLGPNGAGKTTTLDMILGLSEPTAGRVAVMGASPREAIRAGHLGAVLQSGGLLRDLYVEETLTLIASTFTNPVPVKTVLEQAGLQRVARRKVSKCSGGEQQRLRFALALLADPQVLILDEPTTGMDVTSRQEFWQVMHAEAARGRTILFATHYLSEADSFAERIIMLAHGQVVADGTTHEIRSLVSGRSVSARFPQARELARAMDYFQTRAGTSELRAENDRLIIHTEESDAVALEILTNYGGCDLEITPSSLDEAFTALTMKANS